ncbi:M12 family metallo-peptidase [Vibrio tubiashii]|uniref:M12 family metallo-peptidase n=1 Tax=Vibrio tubiashii TaxID=29498 RepID=UPI001EFE172C|nr:M12 family metallo-peptidase [Vibrio tubiashii]MCG9575445.1 M12 family metallo-peptidase [Vibrio tubiashii]
MKRILLAASLSAAFAAQATNLEVSLYYSEGYASSNAVLVSSEIVGFYRSLAAANEVFSRSGASLTLVPAKIEAVPVATFSANENVFNLLTNLESGALKAVTDGNGHFQVALAMNQWNGKNGYAETMSELDYTTIGAGTDYKKATVQVGVLNRFQDGGYRYILPHEILHTIGASHDASDATLFENGSSGENYGYAITCADGSESLMSATVSSNALGVVQKMSGGAGCTDATANMVNFTNKYSALTAGHAASLGINTMTVAVAENVGAETFDFTVTRSVAVTNAKTAYLHISGTGATVGNEIAPVAVSFLANETSKTVTVPFSSIHPMFNDAQPYDGKVYAVAVADNEVSNSAFDLTTVNTQWKDNSNSGSSTPAGGGSGGGGSFGFLTLLGLALATLRSKISFK